MLIFASCLKQMAFNEASSTNKSRLRSLRHGFLDYPVQLDYNKETLIRVRIPKRCIRQVVKSPVFHAGIQRFESFMQYKFALWCNGNTTGFGSVISGSNPLGATR